MTVFEVEVGLRWTDLDAQAHVNNATVVDYLQEARVEVLLDSPNAALLAHGIVIVSHSVVYLAPISYDTEPLRVGVRIGDVGAASLTYAYELSQRGRPVARARSLACVFDFATGAPRRFTHAERAWFDEVAEPLDEWPALEGFRVGDAAHEHPFRVRWSDLDSYGHVNNTLFVNYLGEARVALNHAIDPTVLPTEMASDVTGTLLIARQDLRYVRQLGHRLAPYVVRTAIARIGRTSVTFAHEIADPDDGTVFARAGVVLVHADRTGRPTPVPEAFRAAAERWPALLT
nr:acyl-CoA thioesterase [Propionibacterium sp.]